MHSTLIYTICDQFIGCTILLMLLLTVLKTVIKICYLETVTNYISRKLYIDNSYFCVVHI